MASKEVQAPSWIGKSSGACGGEACIRSTRHTVSGLVQWRRLGLADARILEHHPDLTQADLDAAWSYYEQNPEEIDRAIRQDDDPKMAVRATLGLLPRAWFAEDYSDWKPPEDAEVGGPAAVILPPVDGDQETASLGTDPEFIA